MYLLFDHPGIAVHTVAKPGNYCAARVVGRPVQDRPYLTRDISARWYFLAAPSFNLEELLRAPLPGTVLPTAGSATEAKGVWWPVTHEQHPLVLPVPGQDVLSDAGARAWCASMLLGSTDLYVVWVGRPSPVCTDENWSEALEWLTRHLRLRSSSDSARTRIGVAFDLVTMQDQLPLDATRVVPMPSPSPRDDVKGACCRVWELRAQLSKEQIVAYNAKPEYWEQEWEIGADHAWEVSGMPRVPVPVGWANEAEEGGNQGEEGPYEFDLFGPVPIQEEEIGIAPKSDPRWAARYPNMFEQVVDPYEEEGDELPEEEEVEDDPSWDEWGREGNADFLDHGAGTQCCLIPHESPATFGEGVNWQWSDEDDRWYVFLELGWQRDQQPSVSEGGESVQDRILWPLRCVPKFVGPSSGWC